MLLFVVTERPTEVGGSSFRGLEGRYAALVQQLEKQEECAPKHASDTVYGYGATEVSGGTRACARSARTLLESSAA